MENSITTDISYKLVEDILESPFLYTLISDFIYEHGHITAEQTKEIVTDHLIDVYLTPTEIAMVSWDIVAYRLNMGDVETAPEKEYNEYLMNMLEELGTGAKIEIILGKEPLQNGFSAPYLTGTVLESGACGEMLAHLYTKVYFAGFSIKQSDIDSLLQSLNAHAKEWLIRDSQNT